jgi:hypothetical protein
LNVMAAASGWSRNWERVLRSSFRFPKPAAEKTETRTIAAQR